MVEVIEQTADVPDLVFTANAGIVSGATVRPVALPPPPSASPRPSTSPPGSPTHGFDGRAAARPTSATRAPATPCRSVPTRRPRPRPAVGLPVPLRRRRDHPARRRSPAPSVRPIELVDERLYHLDLTFCPLDDRRALCAPTGWDRYATRVVEALVPEPLWLTDEEALAFTANSVVVGTTVVMPAVPPRVGRQLEAWGFDAGRGRRERVPQGRRGLPLPDPRPRRRPRPPPPLSASGSRCVSGPRRPSGGPPRGSRPGAEPVGERRPPGQHGEGRGDQGEHGVDDDEPDLWPLVAISAMRTIQ